MELQRRRLLAAWLYLLLAAGQPEPASGWSANSTAGQPQETLLLGGKCLAKSSCKSRGRRPELDGGANKRACYCDDGCALYDDCCLDSNSTSGLAERISTGAQRLRATRRQWHCHRINPVFGDVLLKASCPDDWLAADSPLNRLIERRCAHVRSPGQLSDVQSDPVGMMLPITDLASGVTYANSYCLRCNRLAPAASARATRLRPNLIYWSPLLECNYDLDNDDRNTLIDLTSQNKGHVLQYSNRRSKWTIRLANSSSAAATAKVERECNITPTIPDSVEHIIRYCTWNTIDSCAANFSAGSDEQLARAQLECQFGHQSLVYSQTSGAVYFNLACARCNRERQLLCEPRARKTLASVTRVVVQGQEAPAGQANGSEQTLFAPPDSDQDQEPAGLGADAARSRTGAHPGAAISGSFSVLMDLYGGWQAEEPAGGQQRLCPDQLGQVYDPFFLTCRDVVCGLEQRYVEGRCVSGAAEAKFGPALAYITSGCLAVSIASLAMYLALHCLSMVDLRPLVVEMAQAGQAGRMAHNPLEKLRGSRASTESHSAAGAASSAGRSQSLSSRGVACLASSLLAAYVLFIVGHQQAAKLADQEDDIQLDSKATRGCATIAAATYYCFLVAFSWMFLLSYDIWRTLRLATRQLRGPALHSQSKRFLSYSLSALLLSGLVLAGALLLDQVHPITCFQLQPANCNRLEQSLSSFLLTFRPKFGQHAGSCWFSNRRALALFFGLPVTLIMLLNLLFFLHSSYMVIRTSSKSSRRLQKSASQPRSAPAQLSAQRQLSSQPSNATTTTNLSQQSDHFGSTADFSHQNSLTTSSIISVETLQSQLNACSSSGSSSSSSSSPAGSTLEAGQLEDGAPEGAASGPPPSPKRKLEQSQSSSSLATNHSLGASSISASLALKYDAHLQSLGSLMGSIVKDYRLYYRLSTIMGLTWLTGLMASLVDQSEALWYLFVVLNTLQGLFIFIAFGCKRSKLTNVEILLNYMQFKWKLISSKRRDKEKQEAAAS